MILEARSVIFGFHSVWVIRDWLRTISCSRILLHGVGYIRVPSMCFSLLWDLGTTFSGLLSEFVLQFKREHYMLLLSCTTFPFSVVSR